jgi:hypothetical protein
MGEKMTLEQVRDRCISWLGDVACNGWVSGIAADDIRAIFEPHLATPAQTVDVEKESWIEGWMAGFISTMPPLSAIKTVDLRRHAENAWADKLSQAIGDKT